MKPTLLILFALPSVLHAAPIDVYIGGKGISLAKFDTDTGKLSAPKPTSETGGAGFLAWHPDGKTLYAVTSVTGGAGVAGYHVKDDGSLERFTESPITDGGGTHVAVHPSGKFLLTAQYGGGSTAFFPLDDLGKLGEVTVHEHEGGSKVVGRRQDSPHPHWCGFSPDGKYSFTPDLGTDNIHIFKVDLEKPAISPHGLAQSVPGGGPRHMRFSVDGKFIYLLNELALSVTTFAYDAAAGSAKRISTTKSLSDEAKAKENFNSSAEILVHPSGKFVFSSNRGNDSITCFRANPATGKLTVTEVEPIRGAWPRNINIDPTGKFVLAAGANSNTISVFKTDQETGELTFQIRSIVNVPRPTCILFGK